jgi:hypothetical protein
MNVSEEEVTEPAVAEEALEPARVLNRGQDRCDRCGAQAFVLVRGISGELLFCGHHYAKHEAVLDKFAYDVHDERDSINGKSESSA